jgi:uncharacterized protein (DUF427 family)
VDGVSNADAAWEYPNPSPRARDIENRVAFWHGVEVVATARADAGDADVSGQQATQ